MSKVTVVGAGNVGATCANVLAFNEVADEVAVSYTHLDVYKRQVFYEATAQFPNVQHCFFFLYR